MPATERSFTDPLPSALYLDTDIVIAFLIDTEPHHARCRRFLQHVKEHGRTRLYTSSLTWLELVNVIAKESFRTRLSHEIRQRYNLNRWQERPVRRRYIQSVLGAFDTLLDQFVWDEIALTPDIRALATQNIVDYSLGPHDAAHLASATYGGVSDFASLDAAFRPVDGLILWNDLVHDRVET